MGAEHPARTHIPSFGDAFALERAAYPVHREKLVCAEQIASKLQ
jgi:hypothetical protein